MRSQIIQKFQSDDCQRKIWIIKANTPMFADYGRSRQRPRQFFVCRLRADSDIVRVVRKSTVIFMVCVKRHSHRKHQKRLVGRQLGSSFVVIYKSRSWHRIRWRQGFCTAIINRFESYKNYFLFIFNLFNSDNCST